jgi:outer membrane protease
MEQNLIFWIPVKFLQSGFILEQDIHISFLSVCSLPAMDIDTLNHGQGFMKNYRSWITRAAKPTEEIHCVTWSDPQLHHA